MKAIIRKDDQAVSPVIATILMVAITVVLAAVLYVMVSGLITSPGSTPKALGVSVARSADGTNWTLTFTSVPTGLTPATTNLLLTSGSGASVISSTPLSTFSGGLVTVTGGKLYVQYSAAGAASVGAGDILRIATTLSSSTTSTSGYAYQITSGGTILASGTLQ